MNQREMIENIEEYFEESLNQGVEFVSEVLFQEVIDSIDLGWLSHEFMIHGIETGLKSFMVSQLTSGKRKPNYILSGMYYVLNDLQIYLENID